VSVFVTIRAAGALLASGRDSEIFDCGRGLVLRRARSGRSMEKEAKIMRYVARHGYPVPRIEEISTDGSELVMERIDGPTMFAVLTRRPWLLRRNAAMLAALHQRLHAIPAPEWLDARVGGGDCVIHLDLHPLNVIVSSRGPVLVDWTNSARGVGPTDVALTWLLMTAAEIPGGPVQAALGRALRGMFVRSFLDHFDIEIVRRALPAVGQWKCRDHNMRPSEVAAMRRLITRQANRR
jgi:aminoglycoside phosphotransferase (APT) family kinase protein